MIDDTLKNNLISFHLDFTKEQERILIKKVRNLESGVLRTYRVTFNRILQKLVDFENFLEAFDRGSFLRNRTLRYLLYKYSFDISFGSNRVETHPSLEWDFYQRLERIKANMIKELG